jgi:serine/threonine protein phosphatase PrpC
MELLLPLQYCQHYCSNYHRFTARLPQQSTPVLSLPEEGLQDPPDWLFWILASSPVVAIIILLSLGILALLLVLWLRSRRLRQAQEFHEPSVPIGIDQRTIPTQAVETPMPLEIEQALETDIKETAPSRAAQVEHIRTQPTLAATKTVSEPVVVPITGERPAIIGWQIAGLTDVGMRRDHNEDSLLMAEAVMADNGTPYGLYVVADGLGGHQGGEIASQLTIDAIKEQFIQHPPTLATAPYEEWLKADAMAANEAVLAHQEDQEQEKKMGSTLVMAMVIAGEAHIANVGDSRAYHLNADSIKQISVDHSLVERLVQIGQLTREEARTHKNRNVIYNTIGDKTNPEVGLYHVTLDPGDRLLLCSDGLSDMISDGQIFEISRSQATPAEACKALIEAANLAGGSDNITAIVIQMNS